MRRERRLGWNWRSETYRKWIWFFCSVDSRERFSIVELNHSYDFDDEWINISRRKYRCKQQEENRNTTITKKTFLTDRILLWVCLLHLVVSHYRFLRKCNHQVVESHENLYRRKNFSLVDLNAIRILLVNFSAKFAEKKTILHT